MYKTIEQYIPTTNNPVRMSSVQTKQPEQKTRTYSNIQPRDVPDVVLNWNTGKVASTATPHVWGPAKWFDLHVSAAYYPLEASPIVIERMRGRILAIPYEIPCDDCKQHAIAFIENNKYRLDEVCSGRHQLGQFYTDFHNAVNKRHGKPEWNYEDVYKKYSGKAEITHLIVQ